MFFSSRTARIMTATALGLLVAGFISAAQAQDTKKPFSGYSGGDTTTNSIPKPTAPTAPVAPLAAPPVFNSVAPPDVQAPATPATTDTTATTTPPVKDPCAAYMASYDAYNVCQDRVKKIQRMRDAKAARMDAIKKNAEPAAVPAAPEKKAADEKGVTPEQLMEALKKVTTPATDAPAATPK